LTKLAIAISEQNIVARLRELLPGEEFHISEHVLERNGVCATVRVATAHLESDEGPLHFVCTLAITTERKPSGHAHHFFGIYSAAARALANTLAACHFQDVVAATVDVGDRIPLPPNDPLSQAGYTHVIIAGPRLFSPVVPELEAAPDDVIPGVRLLAVVPARPREVTIHREGGLGAFFDERLEAGEDPCTVKL